MSFEKDYVEVYELNSFPNEYEQQFLNFGIKELSDFYEKGRSLAQIEKEFLENIIKKREEEILELRKILVDKDMLSRL